MNKLAAMLAQEVGYQPLPAPGPKRSHPLKAFFKKLGIPQGLIAKHLGYHHGYVRHVLTGQRHASERFSTALYAFAEKVRTEADRLEAEGKADLPG